MTSSAARAAHRDQGRRLRLFRASYVSGISRGRLGGTNGDLQWANKAGKVMALP